MTRTLVIAETHTGAIGIRNTRAAIRFAHELQRATGAAFDILFCGGPDVGEEADGWRLYGAEAVLVAAHPLLQHVLPGRVAEAARQAAHAGGAEYAVCASSTFGRDVLPRLAALMNGPMVTDALSVEGEGGRLRCRRPVLAGNLIATVDLESGPALFAPRSAAFPDPVLAASQSIVLAAPLDAAALPQEVEWIGQETGASDRPDLSSARVVVSGGRPLKSKEEFERLIGGLADRLGGAVGATRAAVDAGIAPNELQVGQTGKIVAPDLYIAAGISGSIQHLAGMKDSRTVAAINTDPGAPIFEVADYGLVADLFQAIPELLDRL